MASAGLPASPSSSKRSRSRDSTRSTTNSSLNTPAANTPFFTPSVSTNSLVIPSSTPSTPVNGDQFPPDGTPYPNFLKLSRAELQTKWARLDLTQLERLRESIQAAGSDTPNPWARCTGEEYALRNRYANVDPYQANRVKLEVPEGHFDYINASPIELESTNSKTILKYIATQGPRGDSWSHIWRMIWKENESTAVIVMLTQAYEANREKCFPYYPQSLLNPDMRVNEHDEFGDGFIHNLHLTSMSHNEDARTQVREIDMAADDGENSKKIWHLLFAGWPDFSVPEGADKMAMMKLVDMSRSKNGDNSTNPRIVHCSAGIGRTGTFIALDWLMQELKEGSLDDVPENDDPIVRIVEQLREQRAGMVQSKSQFVFIYDVLRERWRERWISQHPDEAVSFGVIDSAATTDCEPALKRQKSIQIQENGHEVQPTIDVSEVVLESDADADADAEVEAEAEAEAEAPADAPAPAQPEAEPENTAMECEEDADATAQAEAELENGAMEVEEDNK